MISPLLITLSATTLGEEIARLMHANLHVATFKKFSDSECSVELPDSSQYQGRDVFLFQTSTMPINDTIMGIAFLAQELKQAGAKKITLICPYLGYSRQDISCIKGEVNLILPGHVAIIARLFEASGIEELITVELHNPDIKNYFSIPVRELILDQVIVEHIKWHYSSRTDLCLVAPDKGAADRVAKIALMVGAKVVVFSKERYAADKTRVVGVTGECVGKTAIIIDDIIDTAGTAIHVAEALKGMEFKEIVGLFAHPVLSGDAAERIEKSPFDRIYVSNTVPLSGLHRKIETFDISGTLAEFIWNA